MPAFHQTPPLSPIPECRLTCTSLLKATLYSPPHPEDPYSQDTHAWAYTLFSPLFWVMGLWSMNKSLNTHTNSTPVARIRMGYSGDQNKRWNLPLSRRVLWSLFLRAPVCPRLSAQGKEAGSLFVCSRPPHTWTTVMSRVMSIFWFLLKGWTDWAGWALLTCCWRVGIAHVSQENK